MEDYSDLISRCKNNEEEATIKGLAMGAVILSRMGPRYQKGAVKIFQGLTLKFAPLIHTIITLREFDEFHESFMNYVIEGIESSEGDKLVYGEAQKAINVFLKIYVDRSSLPDSATAERIRPLLHVPLDSVMINYFRKQFPEGYKKYIAPEHSKINQWVQTNHPNPFKIPDAELSKLKNIYQETYTAWQKWFRDIYPTKPVLLDTIWALERENE